MPKQAKQKRISFEDASDSLLMCIAKHEGLDERRSCQAAFDAMSPMFSGKRQLNSKQKASVVGVLKRMGYKDLPKLRKVPSPSPLFGDCYAFPAGGIGP